MFDIGFSEVLVVAVISFFLLDIKDIPKILRYIRKFFHQVNSYFNELKAALEDIETETTKIIDDEGREHIAYNLDEIKPKIRENDERGKS